MKTNWDSYIEKIKEESPEDKRCIEIEDNIDDLIALCTNERIKNKMTQQELGERIGMKQSALARIENFKVTPRIDTIVKILYEFDYRLEPMKTKTTNIIYMKPELYSRTYQKTYQSNSWGFAKMKEVGVN